MKAYANQFDELVKRVGKNLFCFLFYGTDLGAITQASLQVVNAIKSACLSVDQITITQEVLKENSHALSCEVAICSLFADQKIILVRNPTDALLEDLDSILQTSVEKRPILILLADNLNTKSKLVAFCNENPLSLCIGWYLQEEKDLQATIIKELGKNGFIIDPDAVSFLKESLGVDKGMTLAELDKLMLYKGDNKRITKIDVVACLSGSAPASMDEVIFLILSGQRQKAHKKIKILLEEGTSSVAFVRSLLGKIQNVLRIQGLIAQGVKEDDAIKKVCAFVPRNYAPVLKSVVHFWPTATSEKAFLQVLETEKQLKSGLPEELVLFHFIDALCSQTKSFFHT